MTAVGQQTASTPPRLLVRTFWVLHRAAYRLTGGRFGLSHPESGARFGMMRLATVGRRSGKPRMTIIGYYEDGPNLVTLAMNGWGQAEPAWWLNLQAQANATVGLADGRRAVRARAATGPERQRLWARFRDFPGWGDDIDALASHRPSETAVVVLEPRASRAEGVAVEGSPDPRRHQQAQADGAVEVAETNVGDRLRRLRLRHLWIVPGLAIAFFERRSGASRRRDRAAPAVRELRRISRGCWDSVSRTRTARCPRVPFRPSTSCITRCRHSRCSRSPSPASSHRSCT